MSSDERIRATQRIRHRWSTRQHRENSMMAIHGTSNPFGRSKFAPVLKISAIVIGLMALGCIAVAAGEHALSHPRATMGMAANIWEMTARPVTTAPGSRLSADPAPASEASDTRDDGRGPIDTPRKCRLEPGLITECVSN